MSDQNQQQAALPDPQQAYTHLFQNVHSRVFFNKLANYGIEVNTPEEAQGYLELAGKLRAASMDPQFKAAAAENSVIGRMNSQLDHVLGQTGFNSGVKQAAEQEAERERREAVAWLAQDPGMYNSVLSVKAAEAAYYRELEQQNQN